MGALVVKTRTFVEELWADRPCLYFTLSFLISVGGTIFTLGGLAALTAFCFDNPPTGLGKGFKTEPVCGWWVGLWGWLCLQGRGKKCRRDKRASAVEACAHSAGYRTLR